MRLAIALLTCWTAQAAMTCNSVSVRTQTHTTASIYFKTSIPVNATYIGYSASAGVFTNETARKSSYTKVSYGHRIVTGLAPSTTYYGRIYSDAGTDTGTSTCDVSWTTTAAPADRDAITEPSGLPTVGAIPAPTASYTVASDCSDLQSTINTYAAIADTADREIIIPTNAVCETCSGSFGCYSLPVRGHASPGWITIRAAGTIPPVGVRTSENWLDQMPRFRLWKVGQTVLDGMFYVASTSGTKKWRFSGLEFVASGLPSSLRKYKIYSASNTTPITVQMDMTAKVSDLTLTSIVNSGTTATITFHSTHYGTVELQAGDTITISGATVDTDLNGTYTVNSKTSTTVTVTTASVTNATYTESTLTVTHRYHGLSTANVIQVFDAAGNTGVNGYNRKVTVSTRTEFSIDNSVGNGTYSGSGYIAPASGWFPHQAVINLTNANYSNLSSIVIDRNVFRSEFPQRIKTNVPLGYCDSCAVTDNDFETNIWTATDPDDAVLPTTYYSNGYVPIDVDFSLATHALIANNRIGTPGISVYAQSGSRPTVNLPSDVRIFRNYFNWDQQYRLGSATNTTDHTSSNIRHSIEVKQGDRILIEGNHIENTWSSGLEGSGQHEIALRTAGDIGDSQSTYNRMQDVIFRHNLLDRVHGGIMVQAHGVMNIAAEAYEATRRILIENNILNITAKSASQWDEVNASTGIAMPFYFNVGLPEDVNVKNNTVAFSTSRTASSNPLVTIGAAARGSGVKFTNNLFYMNGVTSFMGLYKEPNSPGEGTPAFTTTTALTFWNTAATRGPGVADPYSYWSKNVIIPGVTNTTSAAYETDTAYAYSVANATSYWTDATGLYFRNFAFVGSDTTTAQTKRSAVGWVEKDSDWRLTAGSSYDSGSRGDGYLDAGADANKIDAARGDVKAARVTTIAATTATIAYNAPADAACTVEYGTTNVWGAGSRSADGGGAGVLTDYETRTVNLTGLTTATLYYVRILCPAEQPTLTFTTS